MGGGEQCSLPLLFIDRWVRQSGVRDIINRLIVDLVAAHPENVMKFIHEWSAGPQRKRLSRSSFITADKATRGTGDDHSRGFDWPSRSEDEEWSHSADDESSGSNAKPFREGEPTVQELQTLFPDANSSPFKFLMDNEDLDAQLRLGCSVSFSTNSLGVCIGRGNYGFVVPAVHGEPNTSGAIKEKEKEEETSESWTQEKSSGQSVGESGRMVAIKVSRVQAAWSLEEANALRRVTACRRWLEQQVEMMQRERDKLCGQEHTNGFMLSQQNEINLLESHLRGITLLLQGAKLVTSLLSDVMYDVKRDALWFPLEFYPSSLRECIRARRKLCISSFTSLSSLPDISVNDKGETVMVLLFSLQEIQHVARSLCRALHFLNTSCELCHLDVKVDNILLSSPWVSSGLEVDTPMPVQAEQQSFSSSSTQPPLLQSALTSNAAAVNNTADAHLPQVVLSDLGLAQPLGAPIMQLGDFSTMAPEVYWAGECSDTSYAAYRTQVFCSSSDMWSVGCVLLQMINGLEYAAWEPSDMFEALEENHVSPALRHPEVWPMQLNDFIARCFERDPRRRMRATEALCHPFLAYP